MNKNNPMYKHVLSCAQHPKKVVYENSGGFGLCNRLMTLINCLTLARKLNVPCQMVWTVSRMTSVGFSAVWEPMRGLTELEEVQVNPNSIHVQKQIWVWHFFYEMVAHKYAGWSKDEFKTAMETTLKDLKLKPMYADRVNRKAKEWNLRDCVAIHIRRTDLQILEADRNNGVPRDTENIYRTIDDHIGSYPKSQKFYLAADNKETQVRFRKKYPDRIFTWVTDWKVSKNPNEHIMGERHTSPEDAVMDLYLLSKCKSLIGTSRSSFSQTAATIGGIPMISI